MMAAPGYQLHPDDRALPLDHGLAREPASAPAQSVPASVPAQTEPASAPAQNMPAGNAPARLLLQGDVEEPKKLKPNKTWITSSSVAGSVQRVSSLWSKSSDVTNLGLELITSTTLNLREIVSLFCANSANCREGLATISHCRQSRKDGTSSS